jgi:membrane-associated phospholipid phosphatase
MKDLIYDFYGYNEQIFHEINNAFSGSELQHLFKYISHLFDLEMFAVYYCIILTLLLYRIVKIKQYEQYSFCYDFMVEIGICYACFGVIYAALKFGINMPRPFCSMPEGSFTTILDITKERCQSSFPSSHAGIVFMITLFLWDYIGWYARFAWLTMVILVGLSRIALAMHYPVDILYSLFISAGVYIIGTELYHVMKANFIACIKKRIWRIIVPYAKN